MEFGDQINRQKSLGQTTMNVRRMLTNFIHAVTPTLHAYRRASLTSIVQSACEGSPLTITALGRGISGKAVEKHRIKRADRLLSNTRLQKELPLIYKTLTRLLVASLPRPVILVDWSDLDASGRHFLLRASLAFKGRSMTLYEEVHTRDTKEKPLTHERFLGVLRDILPTECTPVIVSDAGFRVPWFRQVQQLGWDYLGRVRHSTMYCNDEIDWDYTKSLYAQATRTPRVLADVTLARSNPLFTTLVLYKQPAQGRHSLNRKGEPRRSKTSLTAARGADEPWLLATSLSAGSKAKAIAVLQCYKSRMQIEEGFRDQKSIRFGLGLSLQNTSIRARLAVLVMIGTLACMYLYLLGLMGQHAGLTRQYQANTEKRRNVLSCFFLGRRILKTGCHRIPIACWREALHEFRQHTASYAAQWSC